MDQELPLTAPSIFPTTKGLTLLRQKFRAAGGILKAAFSTEDRWFWHAYDYAWRRVHLGDAREVSPTDPQGKWFDAQLVGQAEAWYRSQQKTPRGHVETTAEKEAEQAREKWAREHGCASFKMAMEIGLQIVAKRRPGERHDAAPTMADVTIKDPSAARQAAERIGIRMPYAADAAE